MSETPIFDISICTIFAREVLEAAIIIGQYRTVLFRSPQWQEADKQAQGLLAITVAAIAAALVAFVMIIAVAIPLLIVSKELNPTLIVIVEGVSKIVAAICITELSVKIPRLLGLYPSKKNSSLEGDLTVRSIRFNVGWNIWREVAEIGAYLLPFFLAGQSRSVPLSAVIGSFIGFVIGISVYIANRQQKNMVGLAIAMAILTGLLAIGLFTGGCHLFEIALGETPTAWTIDGDFWDHTKLPMTIFKPFGYTASRTVLQICAYWSWFVLTLLLHYRKFKQSRRILRERAQEELGLGDAEVAEVDEESQNDQSKDETNQENTSADDTEEFSRSALLNP